MLKSIKDFRNTRRRQSWAYFLYGAQPDSRSGLPKAAFNYWKSCLLDQLGDDVIKIMDEQFARCPSPMSKLIVEHIHGEALRPAPSATGFPHRKAGYSILIISQWRDGKQHEQNIAWARETYDLLRRLTPGSVRTATTWMTMRASPV